MQTYTTNQLINNLKRKGINFEKGDKKLFEQYSYYQVINAYKALFVVAIEDIDTIKNNILNNIDIDRYKKCFGINSNIWGISLYREICMRIIKKYGLEYNKNASNKVLEREIKNIGYIHHVYDKKVKYKDFIRMYKFEHELRSLLLRYTLIIEENVKNIFIRELNNIKANANYFSDLNNYNIANMNNTALDTLKLIIDRQGNTHSKPIKRKREQNIIVPYWILINELAMNQTYKTINHLKPDIENKIFQECVNHFTKLNLDIFDSTKSLKTINKEINMINTFKNLLYYIGEFRNMLAHNQPIFSYNVLDDSLRDFPNINYNYPFRANKILTQQEKHNINASMMYKLQLFFGQDQFNSRNMYVNIDLSFIIYIIYKTIITIDNNTSFYEELRNVFIKYNILLTEYKDAVENAQLINILSSKINKLYDYINNTNNSVLDLKKLNRMINNIKLNSNEIKFKKIPSKYKTFDYYQRYKEYTNIDKNYFEQIK